MIDGRIRALERRALAGDIEAHVAAHRERARAGEMLPDRPREDPWEWLSIARGLDEEGRRLFWLRLQFANYLSGGATLNESARDVRSWFTTNYSAAAEQARAWESRMEATREAYRREFLGDPGLVRRSPTRGRSIYPEVLRILDNSESAASAVWASTRIPWIDPFEEARAEADRISRQQVVRISAQDGFAYMRNGRIVDPDRIDS